MGRGRSRKGPARSLADGRSSREHRNHQLSGLFSGLSTSHISRNMTLVHPWSVRAEGEVVRFPTERVGTRARFDEFFEEEREHLFKALYFVTGNRDDAEELTQEAFLKIWEKWDEIDRIDDPVAYLFRIALNGFRARRRRAAIALRKVLPVSEDRDAFVEAEMRADVRRLLLEVTPRQRAALLLVDLLGYPSEQAAHPARPSVHGSGPGEPGPAGPASGRRAGCLACRRCSACPHRRSGRIRAPGSADLKAAESCVATRRRGRSWLPGRSSDRRRRRGSLRADGEQGAPPVTAPPVVPPQTKSRFIDVGSGEETAFTAPAGASDFEFTLDGTMVTYYDFDESGHAQVFVMDADGSNARQLTHGLGGVGGDRSGPSWSPDGSMIAYQRSTADDPRFFVVSLSSGESAMVAQTGRARPRRLGTGRRLDRLLDPRPFDPSFVGPFPRSRDRTDEADRGRRKRSRVVTRRCLDRFQLSVEATGAVRPRQQRRIGTAHHRSIL